MIQNRDIGDKTMPENQPQPPEGWIAEHKSRYAELQDKFNASGQLIYRQLYKELEGPLKDLIRVAAERDELRAENERLKAENQSQKATIAHLQAGTMPTWKDLKGPAK